MADNWQTNFAFYLSIATAAFSGFQWWNTEREQRVSAAIDISRKLLEDNKEIDDIRLMGQYSDPSEFSKKFSDDENRKALRVTLQLEYLAKLMNDTKIDADYVSPSLKCFIVMADKASESSAQRGMSLPTPEAHKFRNTFDTSVCANF